jgi:dimethylamine monooxygenase subunit A
VNKPIYLPFADGQWRMSMGLKALNLHEWIEIDDRFAAELALKDQLLNERYSDVFACLPDSKASQKEVLKLLINHLCDRFPQHYRRQDTTIENITTGQVWTITDFEAAPLDLAGRLVQEDLLLMQPSPEGYILAAASVCFPSRWRLEEKLGCPLAQIHSPVPDYQEKLARPVDGFFDRLKCDRPAWRLNWGIVDSPDLFLPSNAGQTSVDAAISVTNAGEMLWLRVERQTLRRLSESGDILFTIRTYIHPLQVLQDDPEMARNLADAIAQIPLNVQRYKSILPIREALLGYLRSI